MLWPPVPYKISSITSRLPENKKGKKLLLGSYSSVCIGNFALSFLFRVVSCLSLSFLGKSSLSV